MSATPEVLEAAVAARDVERVLAWLAASSARERLAARAVYERFEADGFGGSWESDPSGPEGRYWPTPSHELGYALRLALAEPALRFVGTPPPAELARRVGLALGADWVRAVVERASSDEPYRRVPFRILREWIREGLCERPDADWYTLDFMNGLLQWHYRETDRVGCLRADPGLLEHELWRLFEIPGESDCCLAGMDRFEPDGWAHAILLLVADGDLDRGRVLDATLGALARDFPQFRAGWFSRLHDALDPTDTEVVARKETYLRLLGSTVPPTVALAARALDALEQQDAVSADDLVGSARPALRVRTMRTVRSVLARIATVAEREPERVSDLLVVATEALLHPRAAVQEAVLDLLDAHGDPGDPELRAAVGRATDGIDPTLTERVAPWIDDPVHPLHVVELPTRAELAPLLDERRRLRPLDDRMALVLAVTRLVDDASDAVELELALDGLARLGARVREADPELLAPLAARVRSIGRRSGGDSQFWYRRAALTDGSVTRRIEDDMVWVVRAWVGDDDSGKPPGRLDDAVVPRIFELLFRRFREVAALLRTGGSVQLHSTPTHEGGWIDAAVLAKRRRRDPDGGGPADRALAELRVVPTEGRAGLAPVAADRLPIEVERVVNPNGYVWHRLTLGPGEDESLRVDDHAGPFHMLYEDGPAKLAWLATATPRDLLPLVAFGIDRIGHGLGVTQSRGDGALFLAPLLAPWRPVGGAEARLVALALVAKEPAVHTMAAEVVVTGAESGRLTAREFGAALGFWLPHTLVKPGRWAALLREVAEISGAHAAYVAVALAGALRGDPGAPPRGLHHLLELLIHSLAASGASLTDEDARVYLRELRAGGKTGRLARDLLR